MPRSSRAGSPPRSRSFPAFWPFGLATLAAVLTFATPRLGLAFALAVPILPLGNISLGLAIVYSVLAAGWLGVFWPRPRTALLFVAGPLLAPLGLLALLPLVVLPAGDAARRAAQAAAAVLAAAVVAALAGHALPIVGGEAPDLALAAWAAPLGALSAAPARHRRAPALAPGDARPGRGRSGRRRVPPPRPVGRRRSSERSSLAATLLADPRAAAFPLVAAAWLGGLALSAEPARPSRPVRLPARVRGIVPVRPRLRPVHGS